MVVMKIRVSVSSLSKMQLVIPGKKAFLCKNAYTLCTSCSRFGFHTEGPQEIHTLCYYCFTLDFATPGELVSQG